MLIISIKLIFIQFSLHRINIYFINLKYFSGNMGMVLPEYLSKWATEKVKKGLEMFIVKFFFVIHSN